MELRRFIDLLDQEGLLLVDEKERDWNLEIARIIHELGEKPVLFTRVKDSPVRVVSNVFGYRQAFSMSVGAGDASAGVLPASDPASFINRLRRAISDRVPPIELPAGEKAPCQEVVEKPVFLEKLPILKHLADDGGRYITAGVLTYNCPKYGRNNSFHRMMIIGKDRLVARVVENRGLDTAIRESHGEPLEAAISIGNSPHVMVAASTSPPKGVDELSIANAIEPFTLVKCKTIDVMVPSNAEIIIEGRFIDEKVPEGPFLDLTGTLDIVREQPVFQVSCITHRKDPIYHALLPASTEHEFLMGLPREATMLMELEKIEGFRDVRLTPGGSHWFNAVVQVKRGTRVDAKRLFKAAFTGHPSLKNCVIVDDDIDISDPRDLEFAITTRSQFDRDLYLFKGERGSSLDPSANQVTRETCKVGIDATIPRDKPMDAFIKHSYG